MPVLRSAGAHSGTINWETFLECVQSLRKSDRILVRNFDGGPLNKAQETSLQFPGEPHWFQFLTSHEIQVRFLDRSGIIEVT